MRFYIHYEQEPTYTLAVEWPVERAGRVADLCAQFAAAFTTANAAAGVKLTGPEVGLKTEDGTSIDDGALVLHVVSEGCDLFAERQTAKAATAAVTSVTVDDLHGAYSTIFPSNNRNAASHKWSSWILDRAAELSYSYIRGMSLVRRQLTHFCQ